MRKFEKISSFLSICLILSVVLGNFSLPVLAYEKDNINSEQIRTETTLNNSRKIIDKTGVAINNIKSLSIDKVKKESLSEPKKKLSTDLLKLIDNSFLLLNQNRTQVVSQMKDLKQFVAKEDSVKNIDKRVTNKAHNDLVYVYVDLMQNAQISVIDSVVWKVTDRDEKNHLAVALVEVDKLEALASLNEVRSINSVLQPVTRSGSVITEGDIIHQTDDVRSIYSQEGAGIKIGVISDGVDNIASAKSTGDLPAIVTVIDNSSGGDEGTAMLEIIHDMVPDAQLYFHTGFPNSVVFNNAIDDLVAAGVDVIVDDIGFFDQPYFEDGTIATHVAFVLTANNIVYVSAAGNDGSAGYKNGHYQGDYYNDGINYHDFSRGSDPTNKYLYLGIPSNGEVTIVLQWNDIFGSSGNDYDLRLFNINGYSVLDSSVDAQNGNDNPLEIISYTNTTGNLISAEIDINNYQGLAATKTLELFIYPDNGTWVYNNNLTPVDSIFGHPAVPGVIAVGAIAADDPGNDTIEPYSSQGPVTIIGQSQRAKPDISGIDGVAVTGAGGFSTPFYGTSAAAPHIAAIAAQLWGQYPSATGNQIREHIFNTAIDLGTTGIDTFFGYGRADSLLAFQTGLAITAFSFMTPAATGVINESAKTIAVEVPFGTDITALTPIIVINGVSVSPASGVAQDFTSPVTYTATAESGLAQAYVVTVTVAANTAKAITSFSFSEGEGVIDEDTKTIAVTVPFGTDVTALVPTITTSTGATVSPASGVAQDFTDPVTYIVTAADSFTQAYVVTVTVGANPDITAPVITLLGDNPVNLYVDDSYTDAGATALDDVDGDITADIIVGGDTVATSTIGAYIITYNVSDAAGNPAIEVTRTVNVNEAPDEIPPTLTEVTPVPTPTNDNTPDYTFNIDEAGTIAYSGGCTSTTTDAVAGDNTITFDTLADETYDNCTITVTDIADNESEDLDVSEFTIDTTPPVIDVLGDNPVTVEVGTEYSDAGATAEDENDGDITDNIVTDNSVDFDTVGIYTVTYNVSDAAGNPAAEVTRTVNVGDTTIPVITLLGDNPANVEVGYEYDDAGATASDNYDGDITSSVVTVSNVDYNTVGTYAVTYNVKDSSENAAIEVERSVIVGPDLTSPIITLTGSSTINLILGNTYTDPGYTATDNIDGDITGSVFIGGDTVATSTIGAYVITYNVSDAAGNPADEVTRIVNVSDLEISEQEETAVTTNSVTIAWSTTHPATSRVIWDTVSRSNASTTEAGPLNYGYANSTIEDSTLVTNHSVVVNGLNSNTTYYFRSVSHGSPEIVGDEIVVTTNAPTPPAPPSGGGGGGGGSPATSPTNYSIEINNNATSTDNRMVRLTLKATNASQMVVSNDSAFAGGSYETYATSKDWTLSEGVGQKTVYVRFRSSSGRTVNTLASINLTVSVLTPLEPLVPTRDSEEGRVLGAQKFAEGALIRAIGDIDIWIVKYVGDKQYKRLILSPAVFNNYGHLKWENVLDIDKSDVDSFTTSELVRAVNDTKVYKLFPNGDIGEKKWIKTAEALNRLGYDWDSIYEINAFDRNSYITAQNIE